MDETGQILGETLDAIGYAGPDIPGHQLHAAFELHIEQGPILEMAGQVIGVVTGAQGQRWYEVNLSGTDSHAGTTPMTSRRDALLGLAQVVIMVNDIGKNVGYDARATVGMFRVTPYSQTVIPSHASLSIEFRHPDSLVLESMEQSLLSGLIDIAARTGLEAELESISSYEPVPFDQGCIDHVRNAAEELDYPYQAIISAAGHDACRMARVTPTVMIFIPCVDDLRHSEAEGILPAWAEAGANTLFHSIPETTK